MENKNGQGIFYGVIGVATLVVAIIGATFAYFSASVSAGNGENGIQGQTMGSGEGGAALQLKVEKITWSDAGASSNDLVPAQNLTAATGQAAVTAKCVAAPGGTDTTKYTGCHLYRVVATAGTAMSSAKLSFSKFTLNEVSDKADWNYAVYETSDAKDLATGTYTLGTNVSAATGTNEVTAAKQVFSDAMTQGQSKVYYLLIWVANANEVQNAADTKDVTGSYSGEFTLEAAGGSQVQATFTA